jgi:hypothetical protein
MFRLLDKLFCLFVAVPPLYLLFRFMRWYVKQETEDTESTNTEAESI